MVPALPEYNPRSVEGDVLALWRARRLPPPGGTLGPPNGPVLHQFLGSWTVGDYPSIVAHRAVCADVDARYRMLSGRRSIGNLRQTKGSGPEPPSSIPALLTSLGIWVGGSGTPPWDAADRTVGIQAIAGRLAAQGILTAREDAFRACPSCGVPRGLERIVYDEQEGDTYLVRFPVVVGDRPVNALVWVDTPWKLLGTSALLVHPEIRYVVVQYRRRDDQELILTSASSLDRLRGWIPEATFEVVEEHRGKDLQGHSYVYPLRHEFPIGGDLAPPAGTFLATTDVDDSGTGIVPLVPGHGPTDAQIAERFGVAGWPLVTAKGKLDFTLMHKYAGLDLETTDEFVLRDLSEAVALFAHLRVKRGVPRCSLCGSALFWTPGRAWCLEPSRLPPERRTLYGRLLPDDPFPGPSEVAPWPISEASSSEEPTAIALLECARCEKLDAPDGPAKCSCGGQRTLVRRHLLYSVAGAFGAWARFDPFPDGEPVHLYVGRRRRVPSTINHLAAVSGIQGIVGEVAVTQVPTVATPEISEFVANFGADAVRGALLRGGLADLPRGRFGDNCRQESDRLRRWWLLTRQVVGACDPAMLTAFARPIGGFLAELEAEDRAIVARWEKVRSLAITNYDQWTPGLVLRRAMRFVENDLAEYRELLTPRLALSGNPTTKRGALRTLTHLLRGLSEVLAPVFPFTSEAVHRLLSTDRTSLFEQPLAGLDRSLLNDELVASWDRWRTVLRSVGQFRRQVGVPASAPLPFIALVLPADDVADRFRSEKETLARLVGVQKLEIGSPKEPWTGRQRTVRPVEAEVQKAYPAQASQIIHLLSRMAPRRWEAALGDEELTVVINGLPRRIFPSMVAFADTLPERVIPQPWRLGEMYVELPAGKVPPRTSAPPLSADAFWLVRRVDRRLRRAGAVADPPTRVAIVSAKAPLAVELKAVAEPVARYLGLREFRVVELSEEPIPPTALTGRTRTGDRWAVHIPDLSSRPRRSKPLRAGGRTERISVTGPLASAQEFDYADPAYVAHEEVVRALGQELDDLIGSPLLGPSKIALAWDKGLHSVDDLKAIPIETVVTFPGFGGPVAEVVLTRLGRPPPAGVPARAKLPPRVVPSPPRSRPELVPTELSATSAAPVVPPPEPPAETVVALPPAPILPEPLPPAPTPQVPVEAPETGSPPSPAEAANEGVAPLTAAMAESPGPVMDSAPAPTEPVIESAEVEEALPPVTATPTEGAGPGPEPVVAEIEETNVALPEPELLSEPTPAPETEEPLPSEPFLSETAPTPPEVEPSVEVRPDQVVADAPAEATAEPSAPEAAPMVPPLVAPPEPPSEALITEIPPEPVPSPSTGVGTDERLPEEVTEVPSLPTEVPGTPEVVVASSVERVEAPTTPEQEPPLDQQLSVGREDLPAPPEALPEPETGPTTPALETPEPPAGATTPPGVEVPPPDLTLTPEPALGAPKLVEPEEPPAPQTATPPDVAPVAVEPTPPAPPSGVELAVGDSLPLSLGGFLEATAAGHHGVCLVRESPERIRARVGSRPIEVLWLSNVGRGPSLRPSDLDGAFGFLGRKLLEERVTAFFLEGIEYLVRLHGADPVLNGLVEFDRLARENDARVWVFLNPGLMRPADLDRFRATFGGTGSTPS